jgi:NADPH2:quinone reductase
MPDMRAYTARPGSTHPTLDTRPVPAPGPEEVLIRVLGVALNNGDLSPVDRPQIPGFEFAGEVTVAGAEADSELAGQQVMGITTGAFAEYVVAHHRHIVPIPPGLDAPTAATLPTALTTEYGAARRAGVQDGDTVLITAATSAIAVMGLQVVRHLGAATVIGTTRNASRRAFLTGAGADHVIVTSTDDLAEATRSYTGGRGVDVVLDHIGGNTVDQAIQAARVSGTVVSVGRLASGRADIDLFALARRQVLLQSVSYGLTPPEVLGELFDSVTADLLPGVVDGSICPRVDSIHPFDQLPQAMDRLRSGQANGKVALTLV